MINLKTTATGFAFALAFAGAVSPALAKDRAPRAGFDARAEAVGEAVNVRAEAIRACNDETASKRDYLWGTQQIDEYRACMAERGQPE